MAWLAVTKYMCHRYVPFVEGIIPSFTRSWHVTRFVLQVWHDGCH